VSCCVEQTNGSPGGPSAPDESRTLFEYDFRTANVVPIINGAQTIAGQPFVGANVASAAAFETNPTGLRIAQLASTPAVFTTTSQTAPHVYTELQNVPNWESGVDLIIEVFVAAYTAGPSSVADRCQSGLYRLISDPVAGTGAAAGGLFGGFRRSATLGNLKCIYWAIDTGTGTAIDGNLPGFNSFALKISTDAFVCTSVGNYASGSWSQFASAQVSTQANGPTSSPATRLIIAATFASNAAPSLDFTIERMRVRAA
jgi:hypothetical protein